MDRLDAMRVFVEVAEAPGFAAAARRLRLSPPAVTRAVAALEQRVATRLLHRTTRSVRLTEAGERYLADCKRLLADVEDTEAAARGAGSEPRGQLAVTASVLFGRLYVAPILLDFLAHHRQVTARALFVDRIVHLLDEGFDVAVRIAHLPDSSLTAVRVGQVRRVVVVAPSYLAAHGTPHAPADLTDHDAVGFAQGGVAPAPWIFEPRAGKRRREVGAPRQQLIVNSADVAIAAALAGHGLTRVFSYQVADHVEARRLRIVLAEHEPPPIPVHLVYAGGRHVAAKVRAFVDFAAERLRGHPGLTRLAEERGRARAAERRGRGG
jgi:DNA-binding transcriptional LysR family regulator